MNVFFDGVEALRARYAYLSGRGESICRTEERKGSLCEDVLPTSVRRDGSYLTVDPKMHFVRWPASRGIAPLQSRLADP